MIGRLLVIEAQDVLGRGKSGPINSRCQAVRCLLDGLLGLIQAANETELMKSQGEAPDTIGLAPGAPRKDDGHARASQRSRVSPDIWQDTLSLLCDGEYSVRVDYAEALVFYLLNEMPKHGYVADADGVKGIRRLAEGPLQQAMNMTALLHTGDPGIQFLNAVHAYLYMLSTSSSLGLTSRSPSRSQADNSRVNVIPSTPNESESEGRDFLVQSPSPSRRSFSAPQASRSRKVSMVQRLLEGPASGLSALTAAGPADYANVLKVLTTIHEQLPVRGLLTGIPLLLALDATAMVSDADDPHTLHRINVIKEVVARVWLVIGKVWNSSDILEMTEQVR